MKILEIINFIITALFMFCYSYQFLYIPVSLLFHNRKKMVPEELLRKNRYAVMICARNEEMVIADLIHSIKAQTYPAELIDIYVMADNCTDYTAVYAERAGAEVYTRKNQTYVGKGYALNALLHNINRDHKEGYDAYFVFDADNILTPNYIEEMDRKLAEGYDLVTGYRNSKNYGSNWISAGYGLWFLRESRYLNESRYLLNNSACISGTGFAFTRAIYEELGGWPFHMLTEDLEFSAYQVTKGRKIAFCKDAELYDEQPTEFAQSFRQRLRWSRGYLEVFGGYGKKLISGAMHGSFSCFDMAMNIMPAFFLSIVSILCNVVLGIESAVVGADVLIALHSMAELVWNLYSMMFFIGLITTITEWKHIRASVPKKLLYAVTFPVFMFTYIPISFVALVHKPSWKPIRHTVSASDMGLELMRH